MSHYILASRILMSFSVAFVAIAQQEGDVTHYIAAIEQDKFHGWPANNGAWQWGNEILVGFTQGDIKAQDGHNISGIEASKFARSLDGGATWQMFDPENFLDGPDKRWLPKGKTKLATPLDFAHDCFAMRVFATGYHGNDDPEAGFYYSYDRGATWKGPHFLGDISNHEQFRGKELTPRTDYIITGPGSCFVFISVNDGKASRIACIETNDGGLTFDFVGWVSPETQEFRAIMSQTIRLSNGDFLMAFRKIYTDKSQLESTIDTYRSQDQCRTWSYLSTVKEIKTNSNPPSMIELSDGRLCCVYGDRDARRMVAKYSYDKGETWTSEFVLRDDYATNDDWADMGYPRLVQRPDGSLVALYYWSTDDHPQHYIACSIWQLQRPAEPLKQDLFRQGMNGVPVYRIPALAVTQRGVVVAVSDARAGEGDDLPNDIDLAMRRSLDNGVTWSAPQIIADFGKQGCGDSSLLVDQRNGRLWCFFTYAPDGISVKTSQPGVDGNTFHLYLIFSDDDGANWSKPRNVTAEAKPPEWDAVWSSPGRGFQDDQGRLYFPLSRKSGEMFYSHFIYSDDHGETWHMGGPAGERTEEWMLVQRQDGSLLANMRSHAGKNQRAVAISLDRGITWQGFHHDSSLIDSVCQACLITSKDEHGSFLLFSNPADTERQRLAIKLSRDDGKSWNAERVLHQGPAAYSCMSVLANGEIGILYECGDDTAYRKITFAKFPLRWVSP